MEVKFNKGPLKNTLFEDLNIGDTYYDSGNILYVKLSNDSIADAEWNCMMWNENTQEWYLDSESLSAIVTPCKSELHILE